MNQPSSNKHWSREPMVWMVIAIPLTSVIVGMAMLTIAVMNQDGLVADDYYKRGLAINEVLEREARAGELALTADVEFLASDNRVSVSLSGNPSFEEPAEIRLGFYHATRQGKDEVLSLRRVADGVYSAPMPRLGDGRWYVSAETTDWRLNGVVVVPGQNGFRIRSGDTEAAGDSST
jgi:uncharacterized protein